jgi:hypothetical protein
LAIKYRPSSMIVTPASFLNHMPAPLQALLSSSFFTRAVELPAITMGRQWPMPNRMIREG